jgi:hypothetical protein
MFLDARFGPERRAEPVHWTSGEFMSSPVTSVSFGERAATDLYVQDDVIKVLQSLPENGLHLIVSDHFDIATLDWPALFAAVQRVLSVNGLMRLGFNTSALGATVDEVDAGLGRLLVSIAKAGLSAELLHCPMLGVLDIPFAEPGRLIHRSRKWQVGSHASQSTVVMEVRPGRVDIERAGIKTAIKRSDFPALRATAADVLLADDASADVADLLTTIAGLDGVFDTALARVFVNRHLERLLASPDSRELGLNLLQSILRGAPAGDIAVSAAGILQRHIQAIEGSHRLSYLLGDLLKCDLPTEVADHWSLVLYDRPGRHRLVEKVFSGYMVAALARDFPAQQGSEAPFDPKREVYLSHLGQLGRFGNQITQFAYCLCAAKCLGLNVRTPRWLGSYLFEGGRERELGVVPAMAVTAEPDVRNALLAGESARLAGTSVSGFFNFPFGEVAHARDDFRDAARLDARIAGAIRETDAAVFAAGRYIAVHIRRGDFGYSRFKLTPEHIFEEMVAREDLAGLPIVLLSDAAPGELKLSDAFQRRLLPRGAYDNDAMRMIADWYLLSQAPVLMHANSTYSFSAALHSESPQIFRPAEDYSRLVQYDPWAALPFFG